ncbi:MAG: hypothetical protein ABIJ75_07890 [Actinomycetota bacterium]
MDTEHEYDPLGWWVLGGSALLDLLRRAAGGENPDALMLELDANSDHEDYGEGD